MYSNFSSHILQRTVLYGDKRYNEEDGRGWRTLRIFGQIIGVGDKTLETIYIGALLTKMAPFEFTVWTVRSYDVYREVQLGTHIEGFVLRA